MEKLHLSGRTALITGAGSGIGRALAAEAAARGMTVGISDIDQNAVDETAEFVRAQGSDVYASTVDVSSAESVAAWSKECSTRFPSIALVFSNAGIMYYDDSIAPDLTKWARTLNVNLWGAVNTAAAFMPTLVERDEPAQIIFTGSGASFVAAPRLAAYCASKHAVWALSETIKLELAGQGNSTLGVSLLAPPRVATSLLSDTVDRLTADEGEDAAAAFLAGLLTPEFVARTAFDAAVERTYYILPADENAALYREGRRERVAALI